MFLNSFQPKDGKYRTYKPLHDGMKWFDSIGSDLCVHGTGVSLEEPLQHTVNNANYLLGKYFVDSIFSQFAYLDGIL